MSDFDPKAYLEKKKDGVGNSGGFDPKAYLAKKQTTSDVAAPSVSEEGFSVGKMVRNIPKSGMEFVGGIKDAVMNPIDTAKGLGKIGLGTVQKVIPGEQGYEPYADAAGNFFKERYGGIENIKRTIENDPVGALADASTVVSGAGGVIGKVGQASKIGAVAKTGQTLTRAGQLMEPLGVIKPVAKFAGNRAADVLGITTGVGSENVVQAAKAAAKGGAERQAFKQSMRGQIGGRTIVDDARDSLESIKETRRQDYTSKLSQVKSHQGNLQTQVYALKSDLTGKNGLLKKFGVTLDNNGEVNFTRSPISKDGQAVVKEAIETIRGWGTNPEDITAVGFDTLKRKLDDLIPASGEAKAFITPLKNKVRDTLNKNVPGYEKMTKDYAEASELIKDIQGGLSLTDRAQADTTLRKLNSVLRQNFEFRNTLTGKLDDAGGKNLIQKVAGNQMNTVAPKGLARSVIAGGGVGASIAGSFNPAYLGFLAASSPRLVGEFLLLTGMPAQKIGSTLNAIYKPGRAQAAFQAGRMGQVSNEKR